MKKILLIHPSLGVGGAEKVMAFLANSLAEHYEIELMLLKNLNDTLYIDKRISVKKCNCYSDEPILSKKLFCGLIRLREMSKAIILEIQQFVPELIICFDLRVILSLGLIRQKIGAKILFSERADPYENSKYWSTILKWIYRRIDYVIFQTEKAKNFYGDIVLGKSCVIANPAIPRTKHDKENKLINRDYRIFSAGRFQKRKGFDLLIHAFAIVHPLFPEYELILYGSGTEEPLLRKLIHDYDLGDKIQIMPPLNAVVEKNSNAALFVLPSRSEGIPNIMIEAMLEGIPCISTDCSPGGARLLSNNGEFCLLAENGDSGSLARCICDALGNPEKMKSMAIKAAKSMERFDSVKIGEQWKKILEDLIGIC